MIYYSLRMNTNVTLSHFFHKSDFRHVKDDKSVNGQVITENNRFELKFLEQKLSSMSDQGVPITQLPLQQIMRLKTQFEEELTKLTATIQLTNDQVLKTTQAKGELKQFSTTEEGKAMLVPITESLYVTGKVSTNKRPIIELGTGYFAETSVEKAEAFFNRRIQRLNQQQETLRNSFKEKQQQYQMVVKVANQKIQAAQAAGQR